MFKELKNFIKKLKRFKNYKDGSEFRARYVFTKYFDELPIEKNTILLESSHGKGINGNVFYIAKEIATNENYKHLKIYLTVRKDNYSVIENLVKENGMDRIQLIIVNTDEYCKILTTVEYLVNDTTFLPYFIKKEGQKYLNTWHGTPLKTMGRLVNSEPHLLGNVQRNFLMSDLILFPNEYTKKYMMRDYMLENLYQGEYVITGYPRNEIFLELEFQKALRTELELESKQVIVYMPTWRGASNRLEQFKHQAYTFYHLNEIDKQLNDDQVMYVNLHPLMKGSINFSAFKNIKRFPEAYETYQFLSIADVLITDYSSVFFDFAITGRKIILFDYDREEYLADRGTYTTLDELPFPKVNTISLLIEELKQRDIVPMETFIQEYCSNDHIGSTASLCQYFFLNDKKDLNVVKNVGNNKENILLYGGNFAKNGITTSIMSLLSNLDLEEKNYFVCFDKSKIRNHKDALFTLPQGVDYIPIHGRVDLTIAEAFWQYAYYRLNWNGRTITKKMDSIYKREVKRSFPNENFSSVIHFSGYEQRKIQLFARFNSTRTIFVHNDMIQEMKTRKIQHENTLKYAYRTYDHVALVTEDLRESTKQIAGSEKRICLVNNTHNYQSVIDKANLPLTFDPDTQINMDQEQLVSILESDAKKFITVGRFSGEKGHLRLIDAFNKLWLEDQSLYLIILGGHGVLYKKTLDYAASMEANEHIIIIRSMQNPFPLVKQCDLFVLSSFYEGLGLVLLEADTLKIPVVSTDITGPKLFLEEHGGTLVEDSTEGIYQGMKDYLEGKVSAMGVDYALYNQEAVQQFKNLL